MSRLVEDRALREAFKGGDRAALDTVYREYAKPVYGLVHRALGRSDLFEVDNMVQDIFVKAFAERARNNYDGLRPYRNYLFTIARNTVTDHFRRTRGKSYISLDSSADPDSDPFELADPDAAPEEGALNTEVESLVTGFVEALADTERAIFTARFIDGKSVEACSAELMVSEYRVKRDEKRLRKQFFVHMKSSGYFEGVSTEQALAVMLLLFPWVDSLLRGLS